MVERRREKRGKVMRARLLWLIMALVVSIPNLLPDKTRKMGVETLKTFITYGTPGGMPDWGRQGILSPQEIELVA